jgi:hypothetical protein
LRGVCWGIAIFGRGGGSARPGLGIGWMLHNMRTNMHTNMQTKARN